MGNYWGVLPLPKISWQSLLVLVLILIFAGILRGWRLGYPESQYFDECYYAPGALSYINGTVDENSVHPPLGKLQIADFILLGRLLNNCGFHFSEYTLWRLASFAFGEGTVLLTFLLGWRLSRGSASLANLASFLVSIDFMSIVLARICMLDMVLAFWMLVGVWCSWMYIEAKILQSPRAFSWAVLCSIAFGIATSCKWNGLFGAFIAFWLMLLLPNLITKASLQVETGAEETSSDKAPEKDQLTFANYLRSCFKGSGKKLFKQGSILALLFALSIASIYSLSYLPQFMREGFSSQTVSHIVEAHTVMVKFRYNAKQFTHHYCSQFWAWPTVIRPVWFKFDSGANLALGIVCFGSIFFWWPGFTFVLEFIYFGLKDRRWIWLFLGLSWCIPWIFWAISTTGGFIYYMLPGIPLMAIVMAWVIMDWHKEGWNIAIGIYLAILGSALVCYYPFLAYLPMQRSLFATLFPVIFTQWR